MTIESKVQRHFDRSVEIFDEFYQERKGFWRSWVDRYLRRSMALRFERTLELCRPAQGKEVLDMGCGTGRYSIALALEGAHVLGIDFAPNMIERAKQLAREAGVQDHCHFLVSDLEHLVGDDLFDVVLAIGVLDYVDQAEPFLRKMAERSRGLVIASFPVKWSIWTPQRLLRYKIRRCPLFVYKRAFVDGLLDDLPEWESHVEDLGRDFLLVGRHVPEHVSPTSPGHTRTKRDAA